MRGTRRTRFERHASQVVFDPTSSSFVVTWAKCNRPVEERIAERKDPMAWIPSVSAIAELYDRGCIPRSQIVSAARAIGRAWSAGDRDMLDTEGAKKAAELVHDLSAMCVDASSQAVARDVGQAIRRLLDEMAAVRFAGCDMDDLREEKVIPPLEKSVAECFKIADFITWPYKSMRRRMMYCLNRKERTPVTYTLLSLLFDIGPCPLLSLSDKRAVRAAAMSESGLGGEFLEGTVVSFFKVALRIMRNVKADGDYAKTFSTIPQQQLIDSISGESAPR